MYACNGWDMSKFKVRMPVRYRLVAIIHTGEQPAAACRSKAVYPDTAAVKQDALLLKEMEEANSWGRLSAQMYFGWLALLLTANGLAIGWLVTRDRPLPPFAPLLFGVLMILSFVGIKATLSVRDDLQDCDRRVREVIETSTHRELMEAWSSGPETPLPLKAINTTFRFAGAALVVLMLFWTALEIWWVLERLR